MEKIKWCLGINKGIELVEPSENLARAYITKSEDALKAASNLKDNRDWEISSLYYAMYFALYSILAKTGIKCENHSCTIEFMRVFLSGHFRKEDLALISDSMGLRIDAQYYADRKISEDKYKKLSAGAPSFQAKCKGVLGMIKEEEINSIRKKINAM